MLHIWFTCDYGLQWSFQSSALTKKHNKCISFFLIYGSDCRAELFANTCEDNGMPFCGGEVAHLVIFLSGLTDDLGRDTFSRQDVVAT